MIITITTKGGCVGEYRGVVVPLVALKLLTWLDTGTRNSFTMRHAGGRLALVRGQVASADLAIEPGEEE